MMLSGEQPGRWVSLSRETVCSPPFLTAVTAPRDPGGSPKAWDHVPPWEDQPRGQTGTHARVCTPLPTCYHTHARASLPKAVQRHSHFFTERGRKGSLVLSAKAEK